MFNRHRYIIFIYIDIVEYNNLTGGGFPVFTLNVWGIKVDRGQSMSNTLVTKRRGLDLPPLLVHPLLLVCISFGGLSVKTFIQFFLLILLIIISSNALAEWVDVPMNKRTYECTIKNSYFLSEDGALEKINKEDKKSYNDLSGNRFHIDTKTGTALGDVPNSGFDSVRNVSQKPSEEQGVSIVMNHPGVVDFLRIDTSVTPGADVKAPKGFYWVDSNYIHTGTCE